MESMLFSDVLRRADIKFHEGNYKAAETLCLQLLRTQPDNADVLLLLSAIYFKLDNYTKSMDIAQQVLEKNPIMPEAFNNIGNAHTKLGNHKQALEYYNRAVTAKPKLVDGHVNMANTLLAMGLNEEAVYSYLKALQINGNLHDVRLSLGDVLVNMGRLEDAKACYLKVVDAKPEYAVAWNKLGLVFGYQGEMWLAIHHFEKASVFDPNYLDAHKNLGDCFKEMRIYDRAVCSYTLALQLAPNNPIVLGNLACSYHEQGLLDITIETYKRAIQVQPMFPDAYCNLGNAYKEKGMVADAERCYNTALQMCPSHSDTLNNLANVKREHGLISEAAELYKKALELYPEFAPAHSNYASILQQQGQFADALWHYKEAIRIKPNFADAYSNMGNTLKEMQDLVGAINCYTVAIGINPMFADAHSNLASAYKDSCNINSAIASYQTALTLKPDFPDAFCNLAYCYQIVCNWSEYESRMQKLVAIVARQLETIQYISLHPHHSMLYPLTQKIRKSIASRHAFLCEERNRLLRKKPYEFLVPNWYERLKVGYISSDFCNHPTSHLMQSIPGLHDRSKFEIFCYALNGDDGSSFYKTILEESEHFIDCSAIWPIEKLADMIHATGIHILVNMNGYTKGARNEVFALRPAPVQVMWLGYPGTSGASFIDYIITDETVSPIEREDEYTEKFAYMPNSFFIGDHERMFPHLKERIILTTDVTTVSDNVIVINTTDETPFVERNLLTILEEDDVQLKIVELESMEPILSMLGKNEFETTMDGIKYENGLLISQTDVKTINGETVPKGIIVTCRQQYSLPNDAIVFCNFNQLYKLNPKTFEMWIEILKITPNSVLWLLRFPAEGEANLRLKAIELGVSDSRIVFSNVSGKEEHVRRGQLADICLDTVLCNGHTTSMDILWTGTPIVTLPGDSFASRVAASQLIALNCPELVAKSSKDYKDIAVKLGTDREYLKFMRAKVKEARLRSQLFDTRKYTKDLEYNYTRMFDRYRNNRKPDHINHH